MTRIRRYSDLEHLETFDERFDYLAMPGTIGHDTFGHNRWMNQDFYRSREWRRVRQKVILRDKGCDLGVEDYEIFDDILVHHINPMTAEDIENGEEWILDPEYLITTTVITHNAIHYGTGASPRSPYVERSVGDTRLW